MFTGQKFGQRRGGFSAGCSPSDPPQHSSHTSDLSPQELRQLIDLIQRFSSSVSSRGDTTLTPIQNGEAVRDTRRADDHDDPDPPTPPSGRTSSPPSSYSSFLNA